MDDKGGGGAGKITDGCNEIAPDEDTIVFADGPPGTVLFIEEFITDDGGIPSPVLALFDM